MNYTFANARSFMANISEWNITNVISMENMLEAAISFSGVDLYNSSSNNQSQNK
jgi:Mycoplasma protein of unknown function, DUF285